MKCPDVTSALKALAIDVERKKSSLRQSILSWEDNHPIRYVWREPGTCAYNVLMGEILLEKLKEGAIEAYELFMGLVPSVNVLLELDDEELGDVLTAVNLQHHLETFRKLVRGLAVERKGELPRDTDTLGRISGLPLYRVKAVFCFGYGLPIAVVDPNVFRMLSHIFAADLPPRMPSGLVEALAEGLVCYYEPQRYNGAILDLADMVCRANAPRCSGCPVSDLCDSVPGVQASPRTLVRTV